MLNVADRRSILIGTALFFLVVAAWLMGFFYAPVDQHQGQVYRIIFLHVPVAFTAFLSSLVLFVFSIISLRNPRGQAASWARATAEVGLIYTILTLATGSIWGKPTWNTWWTWDARLTTTFLLALLYAGYLLLYQSLAPGPGRVRACAVLGILIFLDVPIIYKSVTWWNTLHQPQSMLRPGGSTMDPEILYSVVSGIVASCLYGLWLIRLRGTNILLHEEADAASFDQMRA